MFDLSRNIEFSGYYQTMTTKAAITMEVRKINSMYTHAALGKVRTIKRVMGRSMAYRAEAGMKEGTRSSKTF